MAVHESYKWLIDSFVEIAKYDVSVMRIRENGHAERSNDLDLPLSEEEIHRKDLLLRLEPQEREIIASMLEQSRRGAIHDVASFLEGALSSHDIQLTAKHELISGSPFATMHYDLDCRLHGDDWPDS